VTGPRPEPADPGLTEQTFAEWLNAEMMRSYQAHVAANISCPLCGQPGMPGFDAHDDAACEAKMAAWKPTGLLGILSPDVDLGDPAGWRQERLGEWMDGDEEPDDRLDRLAHGFTRDDDWQDDSVLCRNGCGLPYGEVVAGKVRKCRGSERGGDDS
jgi:hypothetical protein